MKTRFSNSYVVIALAIALGMLRAPAAFAADPPSAQWARSVTAGNGESAFVAVAAGHEGSVYVSGTLRSSRRSLFEFGNGVLVKCNPSGTA